VSHQLAGRTEIFAGQEPELPLGAVPYTSALVSIKSFHRLCDGLHTVFLVSPEGMLVDLVDVERYVREYGDVLLRIAWRQHPAATFVSC